MKKIAVSGCFIYNCRYDGKEYINNELQLFLKQLINMNYVLVPICPEQMGGLPTPRIECQRLKDKVVDINSRDLTYNFKKGAENTLKVLQQQNIKLAILKQKSPSCGSGKIYDGNFNKTLIEGNGVTTDLLLKNGISVYSEESICNIELSEY